MDWIATLSCLLYILGCWLLGGRFPFYKFELYAADSWWSQGRRGSCFFADGQECDISQYDGFSALKLEAFDFTGVPTSVQWMVEEAARWVAENPAKSRGQGPVEIAFGFRYMSVGDKGRIQERIEWRTRGYAWTRT